MKLCDNHTVNTRHFPRRRLTFCLDQIACTLGFSKRLNGPPTRLRISLLATACLFLAVTTQAAPADQEYDDADQIEIIDGENRTIYEYRQNGILTMIKIVPKKGRPYYMVPVDGAPIYEGLDHRKKLYPQWVIKEW